MASTWRIAFICIGCSVFAGCTQYGEMSGINRADSLGFQIDPVFLPALPPLPPLPLAPSTPDGYDKQYRDRFVEQWMARSDILCRQYKDRIMMISRDTRLATDATRTILSGLATIFTSLSVVHPLTGAATIVGGVGAAADSDIFQRQSGEIIAAAIRTARENQGNQIERNLTELPLERYNIYRAQRDVAEYHNMCSLETGLSQIRAALKASAPDGGTTPPASQGTQINILQAGVAQAGAAAEVNDKMRAGALAGAAAAPRLGLTSADGAPRGAAAGAAAPSSPRHVAATVAGSAAVLNAIPVHLGPLPAKVNTALVNLIKFIRFQATKPQLDQVIAILGLGPGSNKEVIRRAISNRVTDPARAEQQMKALSDLLIRALGRSFWP